jgi:hypothetical protein
MFFAAQLQAAHPLITEDTGTLGAGGWQLEAYGEDGKARGTGARLYRHDAVLSYGLADALDLQAGVPWVRERASGVGDATLDLKWRFFERGALSLGLKPGITLPTGDEAKGLGAGRAGWGTLLIVTYDAGPYAFHAHAGIKRNRNTLGERESLTHLSGAVAVRAAPDVKVVLDFARTTSADPAATDGERYLVFGAIWSVRKDLDLDLGLKVGHDAAALDEALLLGVTVRW